MPGRSGTATTVTLATFRSWASPRTLLRCSTSGSSLMSVPGRVLERAQDLDDDVVDPAELDRPDLHDLGALVGELEHLLVADDGELAGVGHEPRVGGVDAADVGEDLAAVGPERGGQRDRGRVAAAAPERRDLAVSMAAGALALEPGDDDDLAALELGADAARLDAGDARAAVACRRS